MTQEAHPGFTVDTEAIPEKVDPRFARIRNGHIEDWRNGKVDAVTALRHLLRLYWSTQTATNQETNFYLVDAASEFPVEAGISVEDSGRIWQEELEKGE